MHTNVPKRKVGTGALGAALTTIIIFIIHSTTSVEINGEVGAAIATIIGFGISYFVPEPEHEVEVVFPEDFYDSTLGEDLTDEEVEVPGE